MTDHLDQPIDNGEPAPPSPRRVSGDGDVPPRGTHTRTGSGVRSLA